MQITKKQKITENQEICKYLLKFLRVLGKIQTPVAVLAQLGERLLDVQEVIGSSPVDRRTETTCRSGQVVFCKTQLDNCKTYGNYP